MRLDHAASVFCCASRNREIEDSNPSGTTENQDDTDADVPLRSNQIGCGENPRPVMRYLVKTVLPEATLPACSIVASPAGRSGSLWFGAFNNARASRANISGGGFIGR